MGCLSAAVSTFYKKVGSATADRGIAILVTIRSSMDFEASAVHSPFFSFNPHPMPPDPQKDHSKPSRKGKERDPADLAEKIFAIQRRAAG